MLKQLRKPVLLGRLRRFSVSASLTQNVDRILSPHSSIADKTESLKVLLESDCYQRLRPEALHQTIKVFTMAAFTRSSFELDDELAKSLEAFKDRCLNEETGQALETAIYLNSFASDKRNEGLSNGITLKKIKNRLESASLDVLAKEIEALDTFISFAISNNRSDIADLVFDKANEIYDRSYSALSLRGQITLIGILIQQHQGEVTEKAFLALHSVLADLHEAKPAEFVHILKQLGQLMPVKFSHEILKVESVALSLIRQSNDPTEQLDIFNSVSSFASPQFFAQALSIIANGIALSDVHAACNLLYFGVTSKIMSETLVDALYSRISKDIALWSSSDKLRLFFANKIWDRDIDYIDFEKIRVEIFTTSFIKSLALDELIFFGRNVSQLRSLPDRDRALVLNKVRQMAKSDNPEIKMLFEVNFGSQQN